MAKSVSKQLPQKGIRSFFQQEHVAGYVFAAPFILGFLFFLAIPMVIALYYSFCNYNILSPATFVGLDNYVYMFKDPTFYKTLVVTLEFAVLSVPLKLIFALIVALIVFKGSKLTGFYRAAYYLPSIIGGSVAVSVLWKRMWATDGTINSILGLDISWLGQESTAIWVLIILAVWQFGSSMLIFLSALKQIPTSLYEAARIDGATGWKQFWHITLPLLTPNIHFNLVMQTINGFLAFTQCYIITQGKPLNSTLLYTVYMYQQSFDYHRIGYGAALAWVMLVIVGLITLLLFATKKLWVYEGGF